MIGVSDTHYGSSSNDAASLALTALAGFGIGGFIGAQQLVWPAYFGRSHLGAISGIVRPFATGVNATGPMLMAQSFDRTGGYGFGLAGMALSWVICAGSMFLAKPSSTLETNNDPQTSDSVKPTETDL